MRPAREPAVPVSLPDETALPGSPPPPATDAGHAPTPTALEAPAASLAPSPPPPAVDAGPPALPEPTLQARTPLPAPPPVTTPEVDPREDEISELETLIARDKETIKDLISQRRPMGEDLVADPRLREIAERLPRLQSQLEALRGETSPATR